MTLECITIRQSQQGLSLSAPQRVCEARRRHLPADAYATAQWEVADFGSGTGGSDIWAGRAADPWAMTS